MRDSVNNNSLFTVTLAHDLEKLSQNTSIQETLIDVLSRIQISDEFVFDRPVELRISALIRQKENKQIDHWFDSFEDSKEIVAIHKENFDKILGKPHPYRYVSFERFIRDLPSLCHI